MTETISIVIDRGTNQMATSFLVWGKYRAYPQNDGDGVFVGEIEITAAETSVTTSWTTPNNSANWKFIAIPKYMDQVGIAGRLEAV
jgi:hypothetical protein